MAATNGKTTLVDRITAIANAIRGKTDKTDLLTLPQMVDEINNEWKIKCYVKDFYIRDDGNHYNTDGTVIERDGDWDDYFDLNVAGSGLPVLLSYTTTNQIMLTARTTSGSYENVEWELASAPEGVSPYIHSWSFSASPTGNSGQYQSCILEGINKNCRIYVDCGDKNGNKDNIILNIYVEYI